MKEYQKIDYLGLVKLLFPGQCPWYTSEIAKRPIHIELEAIPKKSLVRGDYYLSFKLRPNREFRRFVNGTIELLANKKLESILERYAKSQEAVILKGLRYFIELFPRGGIVDNYRSTLFIREIIPSKGEIGGLSIAGNDLEGRLSLAEELERRLSLMPEDDS